MMKQFIKGLFVGGTIGGVGGNVSMEASSVFKLSSSGMTNIGGSPIKIG